MYITPLGSKYDFWVVDLGESFVVKNVILAGSFGEGDHNWSPEIYVGNSLPSLTTKPVDTSNLLTCVLMDHWMNTHQAITGTTCNSWTVGRYVIVSNTRDHNSRGNQQFAKVGVYGFKLNDLNW